MGSERSPHRVTVTNPGAIRTKGLGSEVVGRIAVKPTNGPFVDGGVGGGGGGGGGGPNPLRG